MIKHSTCKGGQWECVLSEVCPGTCLQYGEGHFRTFDDLSFTFDGSCSYLLLQDSCSGEGKPQFSVETKNVLCGNPGYTCYRAVQLTVGDAVLQLDGGSYTITPPSASDNFTVQDNTLYLVVTVAVPPPPNQLTLIWNKNMNVLIKLIKSSPVTLCGLCGNFNGKNGDDFTLQNGDLTADTLQFANSWRTDPSCPDAPLLSSTCEINPMRQAWAQRRCDIIKSIVFQPCHDQVYYLPFYEACVQDGCACSTGGDCECICNAVAVYAKECLDQGVCVDWRTPDFCPVYCDFYISHKKVESSYTYIENKTCTWHYQPCLCPFNSLGSPRISNVEGCYKCPSDEYFNEALQRCAPCGESSCRWPCLGRGFCAVCLYDPAKCVSVRAHSNLLGVSS
ncbi:mucin-6-like [Amia ocellicauda]|uniref:mucin-6-like n=1 Tax=Amia ocellicauda TaxID=2972642 RepID=UPI003463ACA1